MELKSKNGKFQINKILLIEDDKDFVNTMTEILTETIGPSAEVTCVHRLEHGLEECVSGDIDLILLDLLLPDSQGVDTFSTIYNRAEDIPIIVIVESNARSDAVTATQLGARDYFIKGEVNSKQLQGSIRYAVEQHVLLEELKELKLIDVETGLYNRGAFLVLGSHYLKLGHRTGRGLYVIVIDVDIEKSKECFVRSKQKTLVIISKILQQSFRRSDIIARYKEWGFVVIALEAKRESGPLLVTRIQKNYTSYINEHDIEDSNPLHIGFIYCDPEILCSIAELTARAHRNLCSYKDK